jgi:MHS family shikimate/dehydroshikimate transporter-like MFS transporter
VGHGIPGPLRLPFFWLLNTETPILIRLAIVLAYAVGNGAMFATQPALFSELFGTNIRYSGVSLGYQTSPVFAGGLAPFIATAMLAWAGWYCPVALYVMAGAHPRGARSVPRSVRAAAR